MPGVIALSRLIFVFAYATLLYMFCSSLNKPARPLHLIRSHDSKIQKDVSSDDESILHSWTTKVNPTYPTVLNTYVSKKKSTNTTSGKTSKTCSPQHNIAFIKTHKTAGTAVQNILFRYGINHGLIFALPRNSHDFKYPKLFKRRFIGRSGYIEYNIICHHMRLDYSEVQRSLPDDAVFITILREPGKVFESSFNFFWDIILPYQRVPHHGKDSMELWLDNANEYSQILREWQPLEIYEYHNLCKNPAMFDLGLSNHVEDERTISSYVTKIKDMFDLVMIADHFLESMVLLADLLCWNLADVACLPLNIQKRKESISVASRNRIYEKARRWNKADTIMYESLNATFWKKVEKYGHERMQRDVKKLHEINANLMRKCVEKNSAVDYERIRDPEYKKTVFKPANVSVLGYNLKRNARQMKLCKELVSTEDFFSKQLYKLHGYRTSAYY